MQTTVGAQVQLDAAFAGQHCMMFRWFIACVIYFDAGCYQELCGQPEAPAFITPGECCHGAF
jgi:hypothetical protein